MAAREQVPGKWMGDVYKLLGAFATHRPDLICLPVETIPGGLLLVLGLDPYSQALREQYDLLAAEMAVPDPQDVPDEVLERRARLPRPPFSTPHSGRFSAKRGCSIYLARRESSDYARRSVATFLS